MTTNWDEVDAAWAQSERGGEASGHLIEFAEDGDDLAGEYGAAPECTCQRCRRAHRQAAEDPRRKP